MLFWGKGARNKGTAVSPPNAPMPFRCADTNLRNSRKPAAEKAGHCRHIMRNLMISHAGSTDFVIRRSQNLPAFSAAGFQEFLSFALATSKRHRCIRRTGGDPFISLGASGRKGRLAYGEAFLRGRCIDSFGGICNLY